jgi:microcystin degradation protein MlrC
VIIADAAAVAHAQPLGATVTLTAGGKSDHFHGEPLTVTGTVVHRGDGAYTTQGSWMTGQSFSMGPTAVLRLEEGITILLVSRATPPFHLEQLTSNAIDPSAASIIVAKGAIAWRAAYESIMASAIEVDTPGCCPIDPETLPRRTRPRTVPAAILRR